MDERTRREMIRRRRIREKRRRRAIRNRIIFGISLILIFLALVFAVRGILGAIRGKGKDGEGASPSAPVSGEKVPGNGEENEDAASETTEPETEETAPPAEEVASFASGYVVTKEEDTAGISDELAPSLFCILVDAETNTVTAEKNGFDRMNPASMTKVLTILTAAEAKPDLDARVAITAEMTDYSFKNDGSSAGFQIGEEVPVRDLFYGTILPSGADAAAALAIYTAGSLDAFTEMMNRKTEELGLSGTSHFTNCAGLYDPEHYTTPADMAMIMKAALENDFCREVLSAHTYTTSATEQHPDGIMLSNWFLRRIEDKDSNGTVLCGKTGYVSQSGNCAVSFQISSGGGRYICVTGGARNSWRCIYDHVALYAAFTRK